MYACTCAGVPVVPIWFCEIDTPIETPTPTLPPPPIAAENAATVAVIAEVLVAVIETAPALVTVPPLMYAFASVATWLIAAAPAPLTAIPAVPEKPAANDAANATASIVASDTSNLPFASVTM